MEKAGTGGSLFRILYKDFLKQSADLLDSEGILSASQDFSEIANRWKLISEIFCTIGETNDIKYVDQAAEVLLDLSLREKSAMEKLVKII